MLSTSAIATTFSRAPLSATVERYPWAVRRRMSRTLRCLADIFRGGRSPSPDDGGDRGSRTAGRAFVRLAGQLISLYRPSPPPVMIIHSAGSQPGSQYRPHPYAAADALISWQPLPRDDEGH